jgi:hypothetical protein
MLIGVSCTVGALLGRHHDLAELGASGGGSFGVGGIGRERGGRDQHESEQTRRESGAV